MERETLGSRLGFILLSAGCAIGIGNVIESIGDISDIVQFRNRGSR